MSSNFSGIPNELKNTHLSKIMISTVCVFGTYLYVYFYMESIGSDFYFQLTEMFGGFVSFVTGFLPGVKHISQQLSENGMEHKIPFVQHMAIATVLFSCLSVLLQMVFSDKIVKTLEKEHQFYFFNKYSLVVWAIAIGLIVYQANFYLYGRELGENGSRSFDLSSGNEDVLYLALSFVVLAQISYITLCLGFSHLYYKFFRNS